MDPCGSDKPAFLVERMTLIPVLRIASNIQDPFFGSSRVQVQAKVVQLKVERFLV